MLDSVLAIITVLTPILTIVVAALFDKNSKKVTLTQQEESDRIVKATTATKDEMMLELNKYNDKIIEMGEHVESLNKLVESRSNEIRKLGGLYKMNCEYVRELANVVTVMAEGLRDQHFDGNITTAVSDYRKFEVGMLSQLIDDAGRVSD